MNLRSFRTFQAIILASMGIYLLLDVMEGHILFYINRRFVILVLLAALALIIMAQFILRERPAVPSEDKETQDEGYSSLSTLHGLRADWVFWLLALPLLMGVLVPERPLGANAVSGRGITTTFTYAPQSSSTRALAIPPATQRSVMDWIRSLGQEPDQAAIEGQPADVTGFVYHDPRLSHNQFMVTRYSITCCVVHAVPLGMVVDWPQAASLPDNQWVRVRGTVHLIQLEGNTLVAIDAESVERTPEPEQPYLFP